MIELNDSWIEQVVAKSWERKTFPLGTRRSYTVDVKALSILPRKFQVQVSTARAKSYTEFRTD